MNKLSVRTGLLAVVVVPTMVMVYMKMMPVVPAGARGYVAAPISWGCYYYARREAYTYYHDCYYCF